MVFGFDFRRRFVSYIEVDDECFDPASGFLYPAVNAKMTSNSKLFYAVILISKKTESKLSRMILLHTVRSGIRMIPVSHEGREVQHQCLKVERTINNAMLHATGPRLERSTSSCLTV